MDLGHWIALIKQKLFNWAVAFVKLLPNLVLAILVFLIFFFAARFLRRFFSRMFLKMSEKPTISDLFSTIIYIVLLLVGFFISLELMHLEKAVTTLLAGAGIIGLALGFAFQDLTANFISGIFIIFRKPFDTGHVVETNGFTGTVEVVHLRSTIIRTTGGLQVTIPNKDIFQKPITNYTLSEKRRIEIAFSVDTIPDTNNILNTIRNALSGVPAINHIEPEIYFTDFTGDKIKVEIWCWVDGSDPENFLKARHDVIQHLAKALAPLFQKG
ncbi:MAG: mechanosensitive ion channel family protein [Chitinophagaceae bacterium]|nr:mechanosensitive ion channel family protein [Chitinophagaceae bacterium]